MRITFCVPVLMAAVLFHAAPAPAQSFGQGVIEIEGPLEAAGVENGTTVIKVMGLTVFVTPDTKLTSPTASLVHGDLGTGPALPGRMDPGFIGGHAIVTGTRDVSGIYAKQVYVEPAENHLIGTVTLNDGTGFEVEGMPVVLLPVSSDAQAYPKQTPESGTPPVAYDPRLPGSPLKNSAGFEIAPGSVQVGSDIVVAGYYVPTPDGKGTIYAYGATASGDDDASQTPRVSILRAECRQRAADEIEWDVRGSTVPPSGSVTILNAAGTVQYGTAAVTPDMSDPGKGQYRYRADIRKATQQCPAGVLARFTVGGKTYTATAVVERR
ncbi:hypothetical protein JL101_014935 [Skermanella rosea]|uniref:hypothetical protein n=1 Tax=Skermanella rosea TaxID=1817965 RepID=UPI001934B057|nr:hypothetical protein [Skermanella rosea]UEM01310.1 hypothetical protein JL101_014935 [Skermanella rosea]